MQLYYFFFHQGSRLRKEAEQRALRIAQLPGTIRQQAMDHTASF
jgi:hypothetical protein